ncbi:MAG TPA: hypothetical protein DEP61_03160 [Lachnospiraceae bacterium]|nr:hypothetical protein [Acutalibacteraceae bacterium]HCE77889.1 hypothetical protein [Lachnospiraceae bacterium]
MAEKESKYKAQMKYNRKNLVAFHIDFKPEVLEAFREKCKENGTTATTEIKKFVNEYIESH